MSVCETFEFFFFLEYLGFFWGGGRAEPWYLSDWDIKMNEDAAVSHMDPDVCPNAASVEQVLVPNSQFPINVNRRNNLKCPVVSDAFTYSASLLMKHL